MERACVGVVWVVFDDDESRANARTIGACFLLHVLVDDFTIFVFICVCVCTVTVRHR